MIQVYQVGNEDFQHNGDAVLFPIGSGDLSVELNGVWQLDAAFPLDENGFWKLLTEEAVLKVPTWQEDEQLYRISKAEKTETSISVIAYPIFWDSANDCFLMDCRPTAKTGQQALDIMLDGTPYTGQSDIAVQATAYFVRRNLMNAINGNEDPTFINRWGGEILYDNRKIIINERIGGDYGFEARYGRNIEGVQYTVDTSELVTRIVPIAYNGHLISGENLNPWVDSPKIHNYAKVYTKEVRYENIRLAQDAGTGDTSGYIICADQEELNAALTAAAEADFENGVDAPEITIDVDVSVARNMANSFVQTTEPILDMQSDIIDDTNDDAILAVIYKQYASMETIGLGDTVHCRHYKLDITADARVIKLTWDCCTKRVTHVTLGSYKYDYVKVVADTVNRIANAITEDGKLIAEQIKGFIDGQNAQFRTQYNLAQRQDVLAILFENLDETSPMYGALGIGTQGLCISKTRTADGRSWVWTTGATANGFNASTIVTGLLADRTGRNYINLDTGEWVISSAGIRTADGVSIDDVTDGINSAIETVSEQVTEYAEDTASELSEWKRYIRFQNGVLELGLEGNPIVLRLINNRIYFSYNGKEVAYFSNNKMYVLDMEAVNSAILCGLVLTKETNGHIIGNLP